MADLVRYVCVRERGDGGARFARLDGDTALFLDAAPWLSARETGEKAARASLRLSYPVEPRKILCVGRNYKAHAAELGSDVPKEPLWFSKPGTSLLAPGGVVRLPPESERVDHEGELGLVIGRGGRRIPVEQALGHVFGYTVVCDVTARDLQKKDGQWTRAKGFDTFCPVGPELVTGVDASALDVRVAVNGEVRQDGNTRNMVFPIAELVAHASRAMTLEPGDLISTGTPEGVGPLAHGDRLVVTIEPLGALELRVERE